MDDTNDKEKRVQRFLALNQNSTRGKLKIYIGMSAGVGKTYRMLEEAHIRACGDIGVGTRRIPGLTGGWTEDEGPGKIAAIGSFAGGIAATVALIVVAPPLARIALSFGPPEFFALMVVGLCLITGLAGQSLLTGLVMADRCVAGPRVPN